MEKRRKNFSVPLTNTERKAVEEWQELMGFSSMSETARFLLFLGQMSLEMASDRPITAGDFARALYTVGSRFFQAEYRPNVRDAVEGFKAWQKTRLETPLRTLSPTKKLG